MEHASRDESLDVRFEHDVAVLARLWLDADVREPATVQRIDTIQQAGDRRGDARIATMSAAFRSLAVALGREGESTLDAQLASLAAQVRASGLRRAQQIVDVAWAHRALHQPAQAAAAMQSLQPQLVVGDDDRPAAERFWAWLIACQLGCVSGDFDTALRCGLVARRLAVESGAAHAMTRATHMLAYTFLSVGDVEAVVTLLEAAIAAAPHQAVRPHALDYNLLLALALSGRIDAASKHLADHPHLLSTRALDGHPAIRCVAAYLMALRGQPATALQALDGLAPAAERAPKSSPAIAANMAWMMAEVQCLAGKPEQALARIDALLADAAAKAWVLSPMNRTQLHRVRAWAAEARGDMATALQALKASQAACYHWVAESVRGRLQALHDDAPRADPDRLQQRLAAVSAAREQVTHDGVTRMLAKVTHEMRNPLQGLISMTSLLALSDLDRRQRQYVSMAQSSAQMLLALCNDILDLARLDAGVFALNPTPTRIRPLLQEVIQVYRGQTDRGQVRLRQWTAPGMPDQLLLDPLRLRQILMNLMSNAVRVTQAGQVMLKARWQGPAEPGQQGLLRIDVVDGGPGLSPRQVARLFQEFDPVAGPRRSALPGAGLGLAICRGLVQRMNGRMEVLSQPGQGSTFWFELPVASVGAASAT